MAQAPQTGMEKTEMKQLLTKSKQEPVNAAFGQSGAKGGEAFAVLMLHKVKNPKAVHKELEAQFGDAKNTRWGTAVVEPEIDSTLVKFIVNREVNGMAKRLVKTLKGTGYRKVEIFLEDGTKVDGAVEEEDEAAAASSAASPAGASAAAPATASAATPTAATSQGADLQKALMALVQRIPAAAGSDAARKATLMKVAGMANDQLKAADFATAATTIGKLAQVLGAGAAAPGAAAPGAAAPGAAAPGAAAPGAAAPGAAAPGAAASGAAAPAAAANGQAAVYAKSSQDWATARQKMVDDIERLRATLVSTYQAEGIAADVEKSYQKVVAPLLGAFDNSLAAKLDAAGKAADPAQRSTLVAEARGIMSRYSAALAHPLIADLDANPFVPLTIQQTLSTTLAGLSATVQ